jgi:hypothetical protein
VVILAMLALSAWCVFCVARTSRERLNLVERMYADPNWQPYHGEFWQVSTQTKGVKMLTFWCCCFVLALGVKLMHMGHE